MKKKDTSGSMEQFFLLQEVQGPVLRLGAGLYRSVIEVTGTHFSLFDESKQQDIHELYHRLFVSLDFPIQIIVQVRPLNIEAYLQYVDPPAQPGPDPWRVLAHDHASFLRVSVQRQPLLGRRFFLIIPAEEMTTRGAAGPLSSWVGDDKQEVSQELDMAQAAQLLRTRYETISYHLQAIGLSCHLLTNRKLIGFYRNFFIPNKLPSQMTEERDYLALDTSHYIRVLQIPDLPRLVALGWLKTLVECDETFDLVHHLVPRSSNDALSYLRRQQTHAQANILYAATAGRTSNAQATIAHNDLGPLVEDVTAGEQAMLDSSLHLIVRATSLEDLQKRTRRISQRVNAAFTRRPRTSYFEQSRVFRSCLPGTMGTRDPQLIPSQIAASMLPFFDHFIFKPSPTSILEGMTVYNEPVILDWFGDLPNANRLIFGPSGWGKSYKAKLDILRLYYVYKLLAQRQALQQDGFQVIIVDPERETTRSQRYNLIERLNGQSIRLSPGSAHCLNPLDLPPVHRVTPHMEMEIDTKEDVLKNHIQRLHRILDCMLAESVQT
jgi:CagE, TrbE, VirB family, component of type IV transporter system